MSTGTPDVPNNGHDRSLRAGSKAGASPRRPVASSHEVRRAPHVSSRSNFFFWVSAPRYRGVACPTRPCAARGTASTSTSRVATTTIGGGAAPPRGHRTQGTTATQTAERVPCACRTAPRAPPRARRHRESPALTREVYGPKAPPSAARAHAGNQLRRAHARRRQHVPIRVTSSGEHAC